MPGRIAPVLRIIDLRNETPSNYSRLMPRAEFDVDAALDRVIPICEAVRHDGETALREFSSQFDRTVPDNLRVPVEAIHAAPDALDPELRDAIAEAIRRRKCVAETIETEPAWAQTDVAPGARIGYRILPVARVGLYVPGGLAPLASSVLHNAIPAIAAGVGSIALATPPQKEFGGLPHPVILAVCAMLGIDEVYAVGGAQAIAMFAYGVDGLCPPVDMVAGPGNIYVVAAKRFLRSVVGIDSEAGPSEICVWADDSANADWVAADLISQAEHDPLAGSVLVTESAEFADAVNRAVEAQLPTNPLHERLAISLAAEQSAIMLVRDQQQALAVVDAYAAEHLEVQTKDSKRDAMLVHNAGAIFVGQHSPVPLGDYSAGSTHVLPTGGQARFTSGLSARSFRKAVHYIEYDAEGLDAVADGVMAFARAESLPGHEAAIAIRSERGERA